MGQLDVGGGPIVPIILVLVGIVLAAGWLDWLLRLIGLICIVAGVVMALGYM